MTTPEEDRVKATLAGLTDSIDLAREEIFQERLDRQAEKAESARALRRSNLVAGLAFVLVVVGFVVFYLQERRDQNQDARFQAEVEQRVVDQCLTSNNSRAAIVASDHGVVDSVVAALGRVAPANPRTVDEQARFDEVLARFSADMHAELNSRQAPLQPRDCSREALGLGGR